MDRSSKMSSGTLRVSEEVIATITKLAATEISGVVDVVTAGKAFKNVILKQSDRNNIRIRLMGDVVEITIGVVLKSGTKVVACAEEIQKNIKSSVQTMTGITVAKVNVLISGIDFDDEKSS